MNPKKRAAADAFKKIRKGWANVKGVQPIKDKKYRRFIQGLPCVLCWGYPGSYQPPGTCQRYWEYERDQGCPSQGSPTEAAHTGKHAYSKKSADRSCIPLCGIEHHREGLHSYHKMGKEFYSFWGLDIDRLVARLNLDYEALKLRKSVPKAGQPGITTPGTPGSQ